MFGIADGSFAEYAVARADKLVQKPAGLTFEQAAVVPISATTAMQGLRDVGHVQAGQRVLIIGASGGVGTYAVQIAKALGAEVTGVCSTAKVDLVRSLGADEVIDYTARGLRRRPTRFDLILDIGGNSRIARLRHALAPKGTVVIVGGEGGKWTGVGRQLRAVALSPFVPQRLAMFVNKERHEDLDAVRQLIETGQVTPIVDRTYPLAEVPDAHATPRSRTRTRQDRDLDLTVPCRRLRGCGAAARRCSEDCCQQQLYSASMSLQLPTVTDAVLLVSRALVGVAARSLAEVEDQVTLTQYRVLVVLASGERNLGELADALDVHASSATRICTRLEAKDLITRGPHPESRREIVVALAPEGRVIVDAVTKRRRRDITRILARIPERERQVLVHALGVFAEAAGEVPEPAWSFGWEHR